MKGGNLLSNFSILHTGYSAASIIDIFNCCNHKDCWNKYSIHADIPIQAEPIAAAEGLLRGSGEPKCLQSSGAIKPHTADRVFAGPISGARFARKALRKTWPENRA